MAPIYLLIVLKDCMEPPMPMANTRVTIIGETGSGKSATINSVAGVGLTTKASSHSTCNMCAVKDNEI